MGSGSNVDVDVRFPSGLSGTSPEAESQEGSLFLLQSKSMSMNVYWSFIWRRSSLRCHCLTVLEREIRDD